MSEIIQCNHCETYSVIPDDDFTANECGSCGNSFSTFPVREPEQEKSPQVAATTQGENTEDLGKNLVNTVYMHDRANSTGIDYATWGGNLMPIAEYFPVIMHFDTIADLMNGQHVDIIMNPACTAEHERRYQLIEEERRKKEIDKRRLEIFREVEERLWEKIHPLNLDLDGIYNQIEEEVTARMKEEGKNND